MCLSNVWTQPPYIDTNSLLFFNPHETLTVLSSHFDFEVNNQHSLPPSIPGLRWDPWARHRTPNCCPGAAAIWLPTALGVFTAACVHLDGLNAEHKFRVWVTLSGHTSLHFSFTKFDYVWQCKSFNSRLLSKWGTIQGSEENSRMDPYSLFMIQLHLQKK